MKKVFLYGKHKLILFNGKIGLNRALRSFSNYYELKVNSYDIAHIPRVKHLNGWSVIIITSSRNIDHLTIAIRSAERELTDTPHEIIVVGPVRIKKKIEKYFSDIPVTLLPYNEFSLWGVGGWITRKKNIGIMHASYDKLVVCHDYIEFIPGWKDGYDAFGDFEVATNRMVNKDGIRHLDWITWDYPGIGQALLPYDVSCNEYQYVNGAYFVAKTDFMLHNLLDEGLRWAEAEDIEWSKRIRSKTRILLNAKSTVTYSKQKPRLADMWNERGELVSKQLKDLKR